MTERERFLDWWYNENMEDRVAADFDAWLEAGNERMHLKDIQRFQKEMAEIAWEAAKEDKNE